MHCFVHIQHANPILAYPDNTPLANYPAGYVPNTAYIYTENAIISKESQGRQGDVRLVLRQNNVVVFGTSGKVYYEVKGTIIYCTD